MGMPQLVVTAVLVEGRSKSEVARQYGVSRRWVITLVQRYLAEGDAGLEPRSRRPRRSPGQTAAAVEDEIIEIRKDLDKPGMRPARRRSRSTSSSVTDRRRPCRRSGGS
jgi:transposase